MRKFSGILLIAFIAFLYFFQNKVVLPFVESFAKSDFFSSGAVEPPTEMRTKMAFIQCNDYIREGIKSTHLVEFSSDDFKAWQTGKNSFLVKSYIYDQDEAGFQVRKNYACTVEYTGGDDTDKRNWSLEGLEIRHL